MIERIVIAGGGTGGHLFPGLALVEELRRRNPEVEVTFVGTARGIEARILPEAGERLELLKVEPLKGRGFGARTRSLALLPAAALQARRLLKDIKPDVVIGVGGYAAGPMVATASSMGFRCALLEQNAHVGLTNRLLSRFVERAYVSFEETAKVFGSERVRVYGNPVRRSFVEAARRAASDPLGFESRAQTIFVVGGSLGARVLNEVVPKALASLDLQARGVRVLHQTGSAMCDEVQARYKELGVEARVESFIGDMAKAYAEAKLVIARAGATTLAELCAIGRPSILVPYPYAADDHQARNAEALAAQGGCVSIREHELSEQKLASEIAALLGDPSRANAMAESARLHGKPEAAAAIVDDLLGWVDGEEQEKVLNSGSADQGDTNASILGTVPAMRGTCGLRGERPYLPKLETRDRLAPTTTRRPVVLDGAVWE